MYFIIWFNLFYHYNIIIIQVNLCHSGLVSLQYGGDTPLHKASANGHKAIVEVLLKADAINNSVNTFIKSRISFIYCNNMYEYQQCNIIIITCMYIYLCLEYQLHQ